MTTLQTGHKQRLFLKASFAYLGWRHFIGVWNLFISSSHLRDGLFIVLWKFNWLFLDNISSLFLKAVINHSRRREAKVWKTFLFNCLFNYFEKCWQNFYRYGVSFREIQEQTLQKWFLFEYLAFSADVVVQWKKSLNYFYREYRDIQFL